MACFMVPGTEAIIVTAAAMILKKHEENKMKISLNAGSVPTQSAGKTGFARKLFWLAGLLWGGVALLAFEHLWHGEVIPVFPFLTAVSEGTTAEMLQEMGTVGVAMAVLVTAVWGVMVAVSYRMEKRAAALPAEEAA